MDDLLVLLLDVVLPLAVHWRAGVPTFLAIPIAVLLSCTLSWFTGWDGILLVIFAFGAGLLWEASFRRRSSSRPAPTKRSEVHRNL